MEPGGIPEKVVGREEHGVLVVAAVAVFVNPIARIALSTPAMAERGLIGGSVEVIKQDEVFSELVMVGCDVATEVDQARIAVALFEVSEDPIVGAIFPDHIEDMPDGGDAAFEAAMEEAIVVLAYGRSEADKLTYNEHGTEFSAW